MYAQFFGNYLLANHVVTGDQKKSSEHLKLGTLAMHAGYMTANEVDQIVIMQTHQDSRFGELAIHEGYLTEAQVAELLQSQSPDFLQLGQTLVDEGLIDNQKLQSLIIDYESQNEIYEDDYSNETQESIDHLVENFFVIAERSLSSFEISFLRLLFTNLVRFIGDDFTPVNPYVCKEYPTNYCVSQKINGRFSLKTYIDMPETACIAFASRYVGETFTAFDEYVQSSLEDSNEFSIELALDPPMVETDELLTFKSETYLLPIVYPFGTIHFIFEIYKSE